MLNINTVQSAIRRSALKALSVGIYQNAFTASPSAKILQIKTGVPAERVKTLAFNMALPQTTVMKFLGLARSSMSHKSTTNALLAKDASELVLGLEALIGQVTVMVAESGDVNGFDAAKWTAAWIETPNAVLGGAAPATYLDTVEGQKLVSRLLAMAQTGAYA